MRLRRGRRSICLHIRRGANCLGDGIVGNMVKVFSIGSLSDKDPSHII